jgi:hypothetical protein
MKTGFRILFIFGFIFIASNAGAITTKAISDKDTSIIIIYKTTLNSYSTHLNTISEKDHIFATIPDTTINIIIISRKLNVLLSKERNQIIQNNELLANLASIKTSCNTEENGNDTKTDLHGNFCNFNSNSIII